MATVSEKHAEAVRILIEEKHDKLVKAFDWEPAGEMYHRFHQLQQPHVSMVDRDLRVAIGEMEIALKEAKRLLASDFQPACRQCRCAGDGD